MDAAAGAEIDIAGGLKGGGWVVDGESAAGAISTADPHATGALVTGRADGGRAGGIEIDGPGGGRDACSKIRGADGDACAAGGDVALRRSERGHAVLGDQDRSDAIVVGVG